jgi:hypothetical protein
VKALILFVSFSGFQKLFPVFTPDCNLIELGSPIDEHQQRAAKVWKRGSQSVSPLYLYVFNNYWHTNYKAEQSGVFEVNVLVRVEEK